jgi:hypothetical protein
VTALAARHLVHGLRVASPVPLAAGPADCAPSDLVLTPVAGTPAVPQGRVLAEVDEGPGRRRHALVAVDDVVHLHLVDAATLTFRPGVEVVELRVDPALPAQLLPVLLAGPGLVAAAILRGHALLHASAVLVPELDGAVAFTGPPGSGKSTLARLLSGPGHPLLSDDALRVDTDDPGAPAVVHRGTTASRLRARTDELARLTGSRADVTGDGRGALTADEAAPATAPLRLVVLPRLAAQLDEIRVVPLSPAAALPALASATPLEGLRDHALLRRQFALAASLVAAVPVVELWVPWSGAALDAGLATSLRAHLSAAPTAERVVV